MDFKVMIAENIKAHIDMEIDNIKELIEIPPKQELGEYSFPCFQLVEKLKKAPNIIAEELKDKLELESFEKIENIGPYLNFFVDKGVFIKSTIDKIIREGEFYGNSNKGKGQKICIEYSSYNIKSIFEIENLLTIAKGKALYKLFKKQGYIVEGINKITGLKTEISEDPLDDKEGIVNRIISNNDIDFVVNELINKRLLTQENGIEAIMLSEYNMPPCIVQNRNREYTDAIRDLTEIIYRKNKYKFDKYIYVASSTRELYFKQKFKVLELAGYEWAKECIHVPFGLVKFSDKRLFIRKNEDIVFERLIIESLNNILKGINKNKVDNKYKKEIIKKASIEAVIFICLNNSKKKDIILNWEQIISFEGETIFNIQYSYAQAIAILSHASEIEIEPTFEKIKSKEELKLVKKLGDFSKYIHLATEKLEPCIITGYVIEIVKCFNEFYSRYSVLNLKDKGLMSARLALVRATCQVIKIGLDLIGIEAIEKI